MFSIVIPLYNKSHVIVRTLASVLNQTYTNFEVIIIDDGSTDDGVEVIKNFTSDERIKIITQLNQGVSVARNNGVSAAKFDYIAFLDGDDEWLPTYLSKIKEATELFPDAGLYCCAGIIDNGDGTECQRLSKKYQNQILQINFFENPHVFVHISATVVSKKIFCQTNGFPVGIWDEDFYLLFAVALLSNVVYIGLKLSIYVGGVEGQSTKITHNEDGSFRLNSIPRHNLLNKLWLSLGGNNNSYIIFLLYELRHSIKGHLQNNDFRTIEKYFDELDSEVKEQFLFFEKILYTKTVFKQVSIFFINLTKIRWRIRGFDVVDTKLYKVEIE